MPVLDYLWVLLGILLSVHQSLPLYTEAKNRARLLRNILLDDIYSLKQKRTLGTEFSSSTNSYSNHQRTAHTDRLYVYRECCPSQTRPFAPEGGLSRDGTLLQLFRDPTTVQIFNETTCVPGVEGRSCRFVDQSYRSKCIQKYAYTYAIVKDFNVTQTYRFDYIKIKSGCSCVVDPTLDDFS